ncbi:hypothetical protein B0A48_15645 [Cryoendolithus antarcticus]|uniref:C2H2-type domain-containing protein n=1 Tax=Cryoendolithus antarcticus TaxID=1507870 RepID=A0A1V8SH72_9PEZI|nr:hypothetical protein B0A48_15645 [Cryoendolithus antarcticus]
MATLAQSQSPPQPTMSAHPFTCNTCQVAFRGSDLQRTHMQSDWHRYNLKRRVASLPPLTSEIFAEKVLANKASAAATAARARFEKKCEACDKVYFSEGAFVNHLGSAKHRALAARLTGGGTETESTTGSTFSLGDPLESASESASTIVGDKEDDEEVDEVAARLGDSQLNGANGHANQKPAADAEKMDEGDEEFEYKAELAQCLFCNYMSPSLDLNVNHMQKQHGFFVPEKDYLVDLPGLVNYLSESIHVLRTCLFCAKGMHSTSGLQTHMRDRGHCMIAYSTEDEQMEVGEFYDFRATYSDDESEDEEETAEGGVSLGVKRVPKTTVQNSNGEDVEMDDEDGWESDGSMSSVPSEEIGSLPIDQQHNYAKLDKHRHHSRTNSQPHKNSDGFHSRAHHTPTAVYHDEYELHLPSGRTAGHRSLRAYYRQNLRNYPSADERAQQQLIEDARHDSDAEDEAEAPTEGRGRQVVSRANGGLGMIGVSDAKKREIRAVEKQQLKAARRAEARYQWGNNKRGNAQKHFRDPLLQ